MDMTVNVYEQSADSSLNLVQVIISFHFCKTIILMK